MKEAVVPSSAAGSVNINPPLNDSEKVGAFPNQREADAVIGSRFMGERPDRVLFFCHMAGNKFLRKLRYREPVPCIEYSLSLFLWSPSCDRPIESLTLKRM
jgi:hypothetical protein